LPILSVESRFVHFLELTFDLIVLNVLTLLCSIPIVTIGVAMTALNRSIFDIRQGKGNIFKGYFKAFAENFRPGLLLGMILVLFSVSFSLYVFFLRDLIAAGDLLVLGGLILIAVFLFFPMTFAFPLLAMFDNSAVRTLANAFLLSFRHVGISLIVLLMNGLPWLFLVVNPQGFFRLSLLFVILGFSLPGWFASNLFIRAFKKYSEF
jgi:uncharacterized membrane protein YesL